MQTRQSSWHKRALYTGLLMAAFGMAANAGVIYNQTTDLKVSFASQNDTTGGNGNFATTYDNFTLGAAATVTEIDWIGSYFNPPSQGNITAFTINFYADNAGIPGAQLFSVNAPFTEAGLGNDLVGNPTFEYSMASNVALNGGITYWLSIVPDLGFPPQWGWETSSGAGDPGDGNGYQVFFGKGGPTGTDMAFTLKGDAATPEPASLTLIGLGLAALGIARRRRHSA
jgi:PEP-CTERM motif